MKAKQIPQAIYDKGAYRLAVNDVWNVPESVNSIRGELKTSGMWQLPVSYRALCVDSERNIYGIRTLTNVQQSGYEIEGRVSVNGKRVRGFSSSMLFYTPSGKLVDVAIIYACMDQPK